MIILRAFYSTVDPKCDSSTLVGDKGHYPRIRRGLGRVSGSISMLPVLSPEPRSPSRLQQCEPGTQHEVILTSVEVRLLRLSEAELGRIVRVGLRWLVPSSGRETPLQD